MLDGAIFHSTCATIYLQDKPQEKLLSVTKALGGFCIAFSFTVACNKYNNVLVSLSAYSTFAHIFYVLLPSLWVWSGKTVML